MRELFAFCGLATTDQTLEFLRRSTNESHPDAYSVFRTGQCDDMWKTELAPEIAREILADLAGTELERFANP